LDALPRPQIVVPGNHDVPMYDLFARFFKPLTKYQRYITHDLEPFYFDGEIAVLGINTARSLTIKHGRINEAQMARIRERLCAYGDEIIKILVTHHPFDLPPGYDQSELVGRARLAMGALAICRVDVLLAGHLHISHTIQTAKRYRIASYSALVVSAGTATSSRHRGEHNAFNVLYINHPCIQVMRLTWQPERADFICSLSEDFVHTSEGWVEKLVARKSDGAQISRPQ
jgi:3',5'-cyclic AMP phosphodiesterase CpdA